MNHLEKAPMALSLEVQSLALRPTHPSQFLSFHLGPVDFMSMAKLAVEENFKDSAICTSLGLTHDGFC